MRRLLFPLLALATSIAPAAAQAPLPLDRRFAELAADRTLPDSVRLHRLFELEWEQRLSECPECATYAGEPGRNDRWTDLAPEAFERRRAQPLASREVLETIARERLGAADQLNFDLARRRVALAIEGARFPEELLAISQLEGPQYRSDVLTASPARTVADYEALLARLRGLPSYLEQVTALLRRGLETGVTPPRITLRDVPAQVLGLLTEAPLESPLLVPFTRIPASIPEPERARLQAAGIELYRTSVRPAYQRLHEFLRDEYVPRARAAIAARELPDGAAWYAYNVRVQTTTSRTPREIHDLGLAEVARIRTAMDSVIRAVGFEGSFKAFTTFLRTDPRFFYADSASLVQGYREIAKRIDPELVKLFGRLPRLPYGIATIPSYAAPSQTTAYYSGGSLEAGRPGLFYVNTYALNTRPKWEMEALTVHEAVPGHHLQIALAQELTELPRFRRFGGETAFVEGWALYSESLGPDLGLYQDAYSKFGQLTYEMWRAIRLVIDTGLHEFGWSRQQAIDYFLANSAKTENDVTVEVDRYISWPGQALAYKSGELKIKELRALAERELGEAFDIRAFHDEVLGEGALPLDVLEARIRAWIGSVQSASRKESAGS